MDRRRRPRSETTKRRMRRAHLGIFAVVRDSGGGGYKLTLPADIGVHIPEDQEFTVELTEEGILYRALPPGTDPPELEAPSWARKEDT